VTAVISLSSPPPTQHSMDRVVSDISELDNGDLELESDVRAVAWLRSRSLESLEEAEERRRLQQHGAGNNNSDRRGVDDSLEDDDEQHALALFDASSFVEAAARDVVAATGGVDGDEDDIVGGSILWQQALPHHAVDVGDLHPHDPLRRLRQHQQLKQQQQQQPPPFSKPPDPKQAEKNRNNEYNLNTTAATVEESIEVDELSEIIRQHHHQHQHQHRHEGKDDDYSSSSSNDDDDDGDDVDVDSCLPADSLVEFSVVHFSTPPRPAAENNNNGSGSGRRFAHHYRLSSSSLSQDDDENDNDEKALLEVTDPSQAPVVTSLLHNNAESSSPLVIRRIARHDDVDDDDDDEEEEEEEDDQQEENQDGNTSNGDITDTLMMEFDKIVALAVLPNQATAAALAADDAQNNSDHDEQQLQQLQQRPGAEISNVTPSPPSPQRSSSFSFRRKLRSSNDEHSQQQLLQEDYDNNEHVDDDKIMTKPNCLQGAASPLWRVATKSRALKSQQQAQQVQQLQAQRLMQQQTSMTVVKPGMIAVAADEDQQEPKSPSRRSLAEESISSNSIRSPSSRYSHRGGRPSPPPPPLMAQPPPSTSPLRAAAAAPPPQIALPSATSNQMQDEIMASSSDTPAPVSPLRQMRQRPERVPPTQQEEKAAIQAAAFQLTSAQQQQPPQRQHPQQQPQPFHFPQQDLSSTSTTADADSNTNNSGSGCSSNLQKKNSTRGINQQERKEAVPQLHPQQREDALSNVPSTVDEQSKERYLAACRFLKSTLMQKDPRNGKISAMPTPDMIQHFMAQQQEQQQQQQQARVEEANQSPYSSKQVAVEPVVEAAEMTRSSSWTNRKKGPRKNQSPTIYLEHADSDIFNVDSVTSSSFGGESSNQGSLTVAAIKTSLRQKQQTLAAFPDLRQQDQRRRDSGSSVTNISSTTRTSPPVSEITPQIHNRKTTLADGLLDEEDDDDETTTETGPSYAAHTLPVGSPAPSMVGSTTSDGVASTTTSVRDYPFMILGNQNRTLPGVLTPRLMEALRGFFPLPIANANFWLKFALSNNNSNSSASSIASSLPILLDRIHHSRYTVIGVETKEGHVFGSFCSSPWRVQSSWFGSNDSLLWRLKRSRKQVDHDVNDNKNNNNYSSNNSSNNSNGGHRRISPNYNFDNEMEIYPCAADEQIQYCTEKTIAVGGGDWNHGDMPRPKSPKMNRDPSGIGFMIDGDLMGGETNPCATFNNPRLSLGTGNNTNNNNEFDIVHLEVWTLTHCTTIEDAEAVEQGLGHGDWAFQEHFGGRRPQAGVGGTGAQQFLSASPTSLLGDDMDFSEV
jgi:TLD